MARIQKNVSQSEKEKNKKNPKVTFTATIRLKGYPTVAKTFRNKSLAEEWAQKTEAAIKDGIYFKTQEAGKRTLAELINRYIENELPQRNSDHDNFKRQLNWWKDRIGAYFLSGITPALLAEYRDKLKAEPSVREFKNGTRIEKERTDATVNRYMAALSVVFSVAVSEYCWLHENPMLKVRKKTEARGRTRFLTDEERKTLLESCKKIHEKYLYKVVVLALSTGARYGEIINLKWAEVDFKNKLIYLLDTKNGESRSVPISGQAYDLLKELHNEKLNKKVVKISSDYVFARSDGKKPMELRNLWYDALEDSGIENLRLHDLRHTAASYLAKNGATLIQLKHILGHKTLAMCARYAHLTEQHTAEILEKMNEQQFAFLEAKA